MTPRPETRKERWNLKRVCQCYGGILKIRPVENMEEEEIEEKFDKTIQELIAERTQQK